MPPKKPTHRRIRSTAKTTGPARRPVKKRPLDIPDEATSKGLLLEAAAKVGDAEVLKVVKEAGEITTKVETAGPLARFLDEIRSMISMVRDFASGDYRNVPFGTIAAVAGALLYVLSPIDLIPDFIPGIGYVDDAAVIAACLKIVAFDLQKYREWKHG
jgi:uncharacterized membrane protein YkvA (DUF1232 family)